MGGRRRKSLRTRCSGTTKRDSAKIRMPGQPGIGAERPSGPHAVRTAVTARCLSTTAAVAVGKHRPPIASRDLSEALPTTRWRRQKCRFATRKLGAPTGSFSSWIPRWMLVVSTPTASHSSHSSSSRGVPIFLTVRAMPQESSRSRALRRPTRTPSAAAFSHADLALAARVRLL